jgi:hypothetical protein
MSVAERSTRHNPRSSRTSDLIGIVSRRKQQSPEENSHRERRVDVWFRIVQRKRELAADVVDIRKQGLCSVHWECPRLVFLPAASREKPSWAKQAKV